MEALKTLFVLFVGGGVGTLLRYGLSQLLNPMSMHFYWGTFGVNAIGSLVLGIVVGLGLNNNVFAGQPLYSFLVVGVCGGFTTFSTFALENQGLLKNGLYLEFGLYAVASMAAGILAITAGLWLSRML